MLAHVAGVPTSVHGQYEGRHARRGELADEWSGNGSLSPLKANQTRADHGASGLWDLARRLGISIGRKSPPWPNENKCSGVCSMT